jgi:electron transfer flavoprotein alpha subunit
MGPPSAIHILREALAIGADEAFLLTDPRFGGADTIATAQVLARFIQTQGFAFDLILTGRFAIDANTGQVGAQLAELLSTPYAGAAKRIELDQTTAYLETELDDGVRSVSISLPAVIAVAERICSPAKPSPEEIDDIPLERVHRIGGRDLGFSITVPNPCTTVDRIDRESLHRLNIVTDGVGDLDAALQLLADRSSQRHANGANAPAATLPLERAAYLCDPEQPALNRHLINYLTAGSGPDGCALSVLATPGLATGDPGFSAVHHIVELHGSVLEDDLIPIIADWLITHPQQLVVAPATSWGREIGARLGVRLHAGVLTDLSGLAIEHPPWVTGWKTVGSIASTATVSTTTAVGIVLLRPDVPRHPASTRSFPSSVTSLTIPSRGRVTLTSSPEFQDILDFANAPIIFGVGAGVAPTDLRRLEALAEATHAQLGCTRKVADQGLMPRSRQIGITGRSIAPELYIGVGTRGSHNHLAGVRMAGVTINLTLARPLTEPGVDLTIVGDWRETLEPLVERLGKLESLSIPPR